MNLKRFVSQAILSTFKGVGDAIDALDQGFSVGSINPFWIEDEASWERSVQIMKFDIKVYAADACGADEIQVCDGAKHANGTEHSLSATISFSIPVIFPAQARHKKPVEDISD